MKEKGGKGGRKEKLRSELKKEKVRIRREGKMMRCKNDEGSKENT